MGDVPCCLLAVSFSYTPTLYQDVESSLARWVQHMTGKRKEIAHQRSDCTSYFIHWLQSNFASSLTVSVFVISFYNMQKPNYWEMQGGARRCKADSGAGLTNIHMHSHTHITYAHIFQLNTDNNPHSWPRLQSHTV